ncbi:MAG: pitrilysin family protein [Chthoniobacteraceae bacterium]
MITLPSPNAEIFTLPNGLTIIVQEDHSAPVANVQAWVETGSIHEDRWLGAGLSHLLEHMIFKGTDQRGASEFAQAVQDEGGYINAYTSFDRTVYWIDIPARGVPVALELLGDAMQHASIPNDELIKEQEVIRREFAMGFDDPDRVASHQLFATAYREHPYRHPVIGHLDVFNAVTRDDVVAYYRGRYVPNNTFFVIVGAVSASEVRDRLAEHYAGSKRAPLPPVGIPREPVQIGRRESHREFATELTRLQSAWHVPSVAHPDAPALDVAAVVLGAGRSARLYRRLREERGIVHSIDAWCWTPRESGLFGIDAILDPAHLVEVQGEMQRALADVLESGVSEIELEKARRLSLSHQLGQLTTVRGKASDLGANWLLTRNLDFSTHYLEDLQRVDAAAIRRALAAYCTDTNSVVCTLNPKGTSQARKAAWTQPVSAPIQRIELSNGLRLLVREDSRLPLISLVATFRGGVLTETPETSGISRLVAKVLLKGTERRTAEQIADELENLGGSIGSDGGNNSLSVTMRVLQPDLQLGMDILADVLRNATLPEKAVAREKEIQLAAIKEEDEEMTSVARRLLRRNLFPAHAYGLNPLGTPQTVAGFGRDALVAFRDQYLVGRNGVVSIFGAVKAEEVRALAEEYFGTLPAGELALANIARPQPLPAAAEVIELQPKQQAVLMVGVHGADMFSPDAVVLELLDEACSDLGSRLFLRIRDQMGLAYFVGSSFMPGFVPGSFTFYLGTDPAKLTAVKEALREEIANLARDGLTAEELARAKAKILGQQDIRNQSNGNFAFLTALDELYGLGYARYLSLHEQIEKVTLDEVRRVARKYFAEQPALTAIARPAE